ncbi:MAG: hypothetical protein FJ095_03470 [Deltaproteobacteria bacterium]|nr:hypothetical protein [Deltaproteobacteria bacterium]
MSQRKLLVVPFLLVVAACASSRAPETALSPASPPAAAAPPATVESKSEERFSRPAGARSESPRATSDAPADAKVANRELEAARAMLREGERALFALEDGAPSQSRARKDDSTGARVVEDEGGAVAKPKKSASPSSPPPSSAEGASGGRAADADDGLGARCAVACKAFASMRRAAERVCELMGEGDEECLDARGRVSRSGERVERSCPTCSRAR